LAIVELPSAQTSRIAHLFAGWQNSYRIDSALAGNSPCRVFVDDAGEPRVALLWVHDTFSIAGAADVEGFNGALDGFIDEVIHPAAEQRGLDFFAILGHPDTDWPSRLPELLGHRELQVNNIHKYRFNEALYRKRRQENSPDPPPGFELRGVTRGLLDELERLEEAGGTPEKLNAKIGNYSVSREHFLDQGFGFVIMEEGRLVSSALSCYFVGDHYEIAIETHDENRRRQSFATRVATAYIDHCLARRLIPVWSADGHNTASQRMARKLGFEKVGEQTEHWFRLK